MATFSTTCKRHLVAALLLFSSATAASAQAPGGGLGSFGGELRGESRIEGKVLCVGCSVEDLQKAHPELTNLYLLKHGQEQAVLEVTNVSDPQRWDAIVFPPELWVRGEDKVLRQLTAEKNLFKKLEITGLLNSDRILDVYNVTVEG